MIPGPEMASLPQIKEMSGLRNLESEFVSYIYFLNYQQPINRFFR